MENEDNISRRLCRICLIFPTLSSGDVMTCIRPALLLCVSGSRLLMTSLMLLSE